MNVNKLTLKKIFDTTERLEAPLFQRPYVWTQEKNWEPLIEAILALAELRLTGHQPRPHFLGTIVLDQLKTPLGEVTARQIIDGQQRLTTLQLALAALRDICGFYKRERYEKAFRQLTDNEVPLSQSEDDIFKVWPTNADQVDFRDTMKANAAEKVRKIPHSDPEDEWLIPNCYLFFYEKFTAWLNENDENCPVERITAVYQTIVDGLHVVGIDLDKEDDAQEIFETLNALGTPLLPADLVKNFLFRSAVEKNIDTNKLYEIYWSSFETDRKYWRQEERQGRLKRPRIDLFLYHYLTLKCGEVLFDSQLFAIFKEFYFKNFAQDPSRHMEEFKIYADIYRSFDNYPEVAPEGLFFRRLLLMDTTTVYPLLLAVFQYHQDPEQRQDLIQILTDIESFLVRRFICELTTKSYNKLFTQLIHEVGEKDIFSSMTIRTFLLNQTAETARWPKDEEFKAAWLDLPFYSRIKVAKTKLVLEAIERSLFTEKTEKVSLQKNLTIEHLMPRSWEEYWPLSFDENMEGDEEKARARRQKMIHKIGNLTLLTHKLNPSLSNSAWSKKRPEILKHSALNMNRCFFGVEVWDEDRIEKRTEELFVEALKIWPRPH